MRGGRRRRQRTAVVDRCGIERAKVTIRCGRDERQEIVRLKIRVGSYVRADMIHRLDAERAAPRRFEPAPYAIEAEDVVPTGLRTSGHSRSSYLRACDHVASPRRRSGRAVRTITAARFSTSPRHIAQFCSSSSSSDGGGAIETPRAGDGERGRLDVLASGGRPTSSSASKPGSGPDRRGGIAPAHVDGRCAEARDKSPCARSSERPSLAASCHPLTVRSDSATVVSAGARARRRETRGSVSTESPPIAFSPLGRKAVMQRRVWVAVRREKSPWRESLGPEHRHNHGAKQHARREG